MSKRQERQRLIRRYKEETGEHEIDMHKVAEFAVSKGWRLPTPPSAIDILAKQFKDAATEEIEYDAQTGNPYRVYHAIPAKTADGQFSLFVYVDINEAPRPQMLKSFVNRREQMVSDAVQLTFDMDHWNRVHPTEEKIALPMDMTPDVEWRINTPKEDDQAA